MKIFIVSNTTEQQMRITATLENENRTINCYTNADELMNARDDAPDLILLDTESAITDCRRWREEVDNQAQIILISADNSLDSRLQAYDAGGSNFLAKPIEQQELQHKVTLAENFITQQQMLSEQVQMATKMAFTAMTTIGEMGITQQFMQASFNATTVEDLIKAIAEGIRGYDLKGLIEIRLGAQARQFSTESETVSQMEKSLLSHAATMGRLFQLSDRMVINYPAITILMSKLPIADEERTGRLRDHLAILTEGANNRLRALEIEQINIAKTLGIARVVAELSEVLDKIQSNQISNQGKVHNINNIFLSTLLEAFIPLGLTNYQEQNLINIAKRAHADLESLRDVDLQIQEQLQLVTEDLNQLMGIS